MHLRPYQSEAIAALRDMLRRGLRRVILVSPTGSGKTVMACALMQSAVARGNRVLVLAHRKELIDQCSEKLDRFGVPHGVQMAEHPRWRPQDPVQVASVATLIRRLTGPRRPEAELIVVDECHHARAETYQKILDSYPGAPVIGLTATPWRSDGKGLGELFQDRVVAATVAQLTASGDLVPSAGFSYEIPDLAQVRTTGGDYN